MEKGPKSYMVQLAYASSVGFAMVLAIFGSLLLGSYLDRKFGTAPKLALIFLLIGVAAGLRNIYKFIKMSFPEEDDEPLRSLKSEPHPKRPIPSKN